jgi:hypothetical protein
VGVVDSSGRLWLESLKYRLCGRSGVKRSGYLERVIQRSLCQEAAVRPPRVTVRQSMFAVAVIAMLLGILSSGAFCFGSSRVLIVERSALSSESTCVVDQAPETPQGGRVYKRPTWTITPRPSRVPGGDSYASACAG